MTIDPRGRYESARLLHSRPHPLQGEHYSNFFIHFRPEGWDSYLASAGITGRLDRGKRAWSVADLQARHAERTRALGRLGGDTIL
eukprot:COSAG01_NODE_8847_length_2638_cov_2.248917_2_plen_85_part_00